MEGRLRLAVWRRFVFARLLARGDLAGRLSLGTAVRVWRRAEFSGDLNDAQQ